MKSLRADIAVIGGGVAGLWARFVLRRAGYGVALLSRGALGDGQTVLSQGILHRGVKYSFSAEAAGVARQLLDAAGAWDAALAGGGGGVQPDLRGVRVLCPRMTLWTTAGFLARFTGAVAAGAMTSRVRELGRDERPSAFAGAPPGVSVWEVDEPAIEAASLVRELSAGADGPIVGVDRVELSGTGGAGEPKVVRINMSDGDSIVLEARTVVLAAGAGNEALLRGAGVDPASACQRRPLHMLTATGAPADVFGHCVQQLSDKPRLTITTSVGAGGARVWYIGGRLAEAGVERSEAEQIAAGQAEVCECLGWLDTGGLAWRSIRVDRAEGQTEDGGRPDGPVVRRWGSVIAAWPTKLALAPTTAGMVISAVREAGVAPEGVCDVPAGLPTPGVARPPWGGGAS